MSRVAVGDGLVTTTSRIRWSIRISV